MSPPIIQIEAVSKRFMIYHNKIQSLKDHAINIFKLKKTHQTPAEIFWVLRDIDLQVQAGETIGLLGHNGSGKSTLLRLVAKIMLPTSGKITVRGKVAPMIELGLGFHPELTGEENIYLNASLYGLTRRQIDLIYEKIVDFSELRHFIDTPVKNYSSGMQARLGFSIAVHLDPEILLVDEVLAVGDERFQKKCYEKIQSFKRLGKTIVFVSHSIKTVQELCDRAYLLDHGRMIAEGSVSSVSERYSAVQLV
jgi:ABC-type polysaccharide/polyol phosphate transport system ATPase subunit